MDKFLVNFLIVICCAFLLLPQPINMMRIKRSDNQVNATALKADSGQLFIDKPLAKIANLTEPTGIANVVPIKVSKESQPEMKVNDRMHRGKRRLELVDDPSVQVKAAHHGHHHHDNGGSNIAPPFVYYNKMISPDGKSEMKEFQLVAPNVVMESLQRDMNYGPIPEMGGVLLLNADNNLNGRFHGLAQSKHHHKPKSSLGLPPFLYLLQQMLQPNLNLDMEPQMPRNRIDSPIYQLFDNAVDNALRNNHEVMEHEHNNGFNDKEQDNYHDLDFPSHKLELNKEEKLKESNDIMPNRKDDELIVSCPIHHDHHAGNNGETIDDDVVLVNECHIV